MSEFQANSSSERIRHRRNVLLYKESLYFTPPYRKDLPNYTVKYLLTNGKTQLYTICNYGDECNSVPYAQGTVEYTILVNQAITSQDILNHLPLLNASAFTYTAEVLDHSPSYVIQIHYKYMLTDNSDGFSFYNTDLPESSVYTWYNTYCSNINITSFGNIPLSRAGSQFYSLKNLSISDTAPTILPNTTGYQMFQDCTEFSPVYMNWNLTHLTSMEKMFYGCILFNPPYLNWSIPSVTSMSQTFQDCTAFNPLVFQLSNSTQIATMYRTFKNCTSFNTDIVGWNVASVSNMNETFYNCTNCTVNLSTWNASIIAVHVGFSTWSPLVPPAVWV